MPERIESEHESFGLISVHRSHSNKKQPLFGSALKHDTMIRLEIYRAKKIRNISHDWYHQKGLPIIRIEMSPAQFAEFITSMNMGNGIPCTIDFVDGRDMEEPPIDNPREMIEDEFKTRIQNTFDWLDGALEDATAMFDKKGTITKGSINALLGKLRMMRQEIEANMPYTAKCFNQAMDKVVEHAKAEVEAFVTGTAMQLGKDAMMALGKPEFANALTTQGEPHKVTAGPCKPEDCDTCENAVIKSTCQNGRIDISMK